MLERRPPKLQREMVLLRNSGQRADLLSFGGVFGHKLVIIFLSIDL